MSLLGLEGQLRVIEGHMVASGDHMVEVKGQESESAAAKMHVEVMLEESTALMQQTLFTHSKWEQMSLQGIFYGTWPYLLMM